MKKSLVLLAFFSAQAALASVPTELSIQARFEYSPNPIVVDGPEHGKIVFLSTLLTGAVFSERIMDQLYLAGAASMTFVTPEAGECAPDTVDFPYIGMGADAGLQILATDARGSSACQDFLGLFKDGVVIRFTDVPLMNDRASKIGVVTITVDKF